MSPRSRRTSPACPRCGRDARPVATPANIARFAAIIVGIWLATSFPLRLRMRCRACRHQFAFDTAEMAPVESPDPVGRKYGPGARDDRSPPTKGRE